jgi:hypothetical protein
MRRSHAPQPAPEGRRPGRASATTAAGIAAERVALAERERRIAHARTEARQLEPRGAAA